MKNDESKMAHDCAAIAVCGCCMHAIDKETRRAIMKKLLPIVAVFLAVAGPAVALDWNTCLEYMYPEADPHTAWTLQDDGQGVYISKWNLAKPQPTETQLESVEAEAVIWKMNKTKTEKADFESWEKEELTALVKVMMAELNLLRSELGLPALSVEQLKLNLKNNM